jgi:hypothetical protein
VLNLWATILGGDECQTQLPAIFLNFDFIMQTLVADTGLLSVLTMKHPVYKTGLLSELNIQRSVCVPGIPSGLKIKRPVSETGISFSNPGFSVSNLGFSVSNPELLFSVPVFCSQSGPHPGLGCEVIGEK